MPWPWTFRAMGTALVAGFCSIRFFTCKACQWSAGSPRLSKLPFKHSAIQNQVDNVKYTILYVHITYHNHCSMNNMNLLLNDTVQWCIQLIWMLCNTKSFSIHGHPFTLASDDTDRQPLAFPWLIDCSPVAPTLVQIALCPPHTTLCQLHSSFCLSQELWVA